MSKILAIGWKEVYVRFTDRNLVLLMIVTPIVLSTIIGLAFSRVGSNDVPIEDIPVAVLNLDQGGGFGVNYGDIYVAALVQGEGEKILGGGVVDCGSQNGPAAESTAETQSESAIFDLTDAVSFDQETAARLIATGDIDPPAGVAGSPDYLEAAARQAVEKEIFAAAVIIPEDFTSKIAYVPGGEAQFPETGVLVFADAARSISGGIIHSITAGITNQIVAGNITLAATFEELQDAMPQGGSTVPQLDMASVAACAFQQGPGTIQLVVEEIETEATESVTLALFVRFGSAQAMFFGMFTAGFGVLSMYDERRNWTLQRLIISPTPRSSIMVGKLVGVFLAVLFQITLLLIAMTAVASVVTREPVSIWGEDLVRVVLITLAAAFSVTGFGMFIAGVARSPEQGQIFNTVFAIGLAVLGGSFGFILPPEISRFSLIYWGRTAYETLAFSGGAVALNIIVLAAMGAFFFLLGLYFFNRRFDVTG